MGENCRSGCNTKDHGSYAECLRAADVRVAYTNSANYQDFTRQKKWDAELNRYASLVKSGLQPNGTTHRAMDKAERLAERGIHERVTAPLKE